MPKRKACILDHDDLDDFQEENKSPPKTPKGKINFPLGHCLINDKWRHHVIPKGLSKIMSVKILDKLGVIDFQPSPKLATVFLVQIRFFYYLQ